MIMDRARVLSLEGFSAGGWLEARLTDRRDYFSPLEFMVACRHRLGALQPIVPRGGRCPVTGEQLDGMGLSCLHTSGAAVIARHDSVNRQVVQLAKRCTQGVVHTEMLGCFGDGSGQKRGDCVIESAGRSGFRGGVVAGVRQGLGQAGLEVCDTAVSAPHAASYVQAAQQPLGTATAREGSKESKHGEHVRQGGESSHHWSGSPLVHWGLWVWSGGRGCWRERRCRGTPQRREAEPEGSSL
jgi:hypothetical protein